MGRTGRFIGRCRHHAPTLLHTQNEVANVDFVVVLDHQRTGYLASIDICPVGALEVDDYELAVLEDDTVTKMYNDAYDDKEIAVEDRELAEEMLSISAIHEEKEKW